MLTKAQAKIREYKPANQGMDYSGMTHTGSLIDYLGMTYNQHRIWYVLLRHDQHWVWYGLHLKNLS